MKNASKTAPLSLLGQDYQWAEYLHSMEGIPDDAARISVATLKKSAVIQGFLACSVVTLAALMLAGVPMWPFTISGGRHPVEPMTLAIVIGMVIGNCCNLPKSLRPGIRFAQSNLLALGIILLGVQLNLFDVLRMGFVGVGMSCFEIVLALVIMWFLTRWFRLSSRLGVLLGVGTAICGSSAIMATAPVIEAEEGDVVFGVATVTLLGLAGMFLLPLLGHALQMTATAFGVLDGLVIHAIPQVVAAGFAYSNSAGATATIVKMTRVCLLAPMVLVIGMIYARRKARRTQKLPGAGQARSPFQLFPKFIFGFLAMALARTLGLLPEINVRLPEAAWAGHLQREVDVLAILRTAAGFCLVMSMAAVGFETKYSALARAGTKPLLAGLISSILILLAVLALIRLFKIG